MQKRYQVFVSSTYQDLKEERAEIMQALLELDCMPAGMELFPAASEEQWSWIKRVIEESDYYIVVIGGRYGSVHKGLGISYTEMEYRYAIEIGKPVIAFLHEEPESLPRKRTETKASTQEKLEEFRALCQTKLCKFWTSPIDLGAKVSRSITQLQKHHPSDGWIKVSSLRDLESSAIRELKDEIELLEERLKASNELSSLEFDFADGDGEIELYFHYELKEKTNKQGQPPVLGGM